MQARTRREQACWVMLLALACQLLLALAHHHPHVGHGFKEVDAKAPACIELSTTCESSGDAPTDRDPEDCAICWAMAASAAVIVPVLLVLLLAFERPKPATGHSTAPFRRDHLGRLFRARGPPGVCTA